MYFRYPPAIYRWLLPGGTIWRLPKSGSRNIALTFDDGPDPLVTTQVLDILASADARATFFCTGQHLEREPILHERIIADGHHIGNHGYQHLDGWKTPLSTYLENARRGAEITGSSSFRPPYGRITVSQARGLAVDNTLYLWSLLSGDFDQHRTGEECLGRLIRHTVTRDIVVFHDTRRAASRVLHVLPSYLNFLRQNSYLFEIL